MRIALISLPWHSPYRPSIQIEALAAYIKENVSFRAEIETYHDHLGVSRYIDYETVKKIADGYFSSWLGEALSAYLLFPENAGNIMSLIKYLLKDSMTEQDVAKKLILPYKKFIAERAEAYANGNYKIIGLTVTLCQTFSSLLMAQEIRKSCKDSYIILGGAVVSGDKVARSVLSCFPSVDGICLCEGELPLTELVETLHNNQPANSLNIKGIMTRRSIDAETQSRQQLSSLEKLPILNYFSYFNLLSIIKDNPIIRADIELPIETSRGCWWNKCNFCNLNFQWDGYREKTIEHHLLEIDNLIKCTGLSKFIVVDNIQRKDEQSIKRQFIALEEKYEGKLDLYLEATANISPDIWEYFCKAGVSNCQIGIESLSNSVLKKINKGTSLLKNIQAMKNSEKYGIKNPGNILYDLPQMTDEELEENIENISYVKSYYPLGLVKFFLNYGSPYYNILFNNSLTNDTSISQDNQNYRAWNIMLPKPLNDKFFSPQREFEKIDLQNPYLQKLQTTCHEWSDNYFKMKSSGIKYLLQAKYRGKKRRLINIEDFREGKKKIFHLSELESKIYLFFDQKIAMIEDCYQEFPNIEKDKIDAILVYFMMNKLVYKENNRLLSLAIICE